MATTCPDLRIPFQDEFQGSRSPYFGPKFCPIPNAKKVCFFPNSRHKIHNFTTITLYIKKKGKFDYWNQSSNGNVIHKEYVRFPNFSRTPLIFPIPWAPAPFPKRGVRALNLSITCALFVLMRYIPVNYFSVILGCFPVFL